MRYITFLFLIMTLSVAQIQYGGIPKYESNTNPIKFITTENLDIIEYEDFNYLKQRLEKTLNQF